MIYANHHLTDDSHLFSPEIRKVFKKLLTAAVVRVYCVLNGHSKIDKTKVLKTNCSLMKVESIAECSLGAFGNTFDLH